MCMRRTMPNLPNSLTIFIGKHKLLFALAAFFIVAVLSYSVFLYYRIAKDEALWQQAQRFDGTYALYTFPALVRPGEEVTIYGVGFLRRGNSVYLNNKKVAYNISSPDLISLAFRIPSDINPGVYDVAVENNLGKVKNKARLTVVPPSTIKSPQISSISPIIAKPGEIITLLGSGFTGRNTIRTSFGVFENVASDDGRTLVFTLTPSFDGWVEASVSQKDKSLQKALDAWVIVENEGGMSNVVKFRVVQE